MEQANKASERRHFWIFCIIAAFAIFALLGYLYFIHWDVFFNSDNALIGLMAKWILEKGERPIFVWGVGYQGVFLEAYLSALFFKFFGVSPGVLSLAPLFYLLLFLVAFLIWATRLTGKNVAGAALLYFVASSPLLYHLCARTLPNFPETFLLGILFWLSYEKAWETRKTVWIVLTALIAGFAQYTFILSAFFIVPVLTHLGLVLGRDVFFEQGAQAFWNRLSMRQPLSRRSLEYIRQLLKWLAIVNIAWGAITFILYIPSVQFGPHIVKWDSLAVLFSGLMLYGAIQVFYFLDVIRINSRRHLLKTIALVILGFLAGLSPKLYFHFVLGGTTLKTAHMSGTLMDIARRFRFFYESQANTFSIDGHWALRVVFGLFIALCAITFWISCVRGFGQWWRDRTSTWKAERWIPIAMFPIFIVVSSLFAAASVDNFAVQRYSFVLMIFYSMAIANQVAGKRSIIAAILAVLLLVQSALAINRSLTEDGKKDLYSSIIRTLDENKVTRAYANYWYGYVTAFITNERIIVEPVFSNYSPHFGPMVETAEVVAYVDKKGKHWINDDGDSVTIRNQTYAIEKRVDVSKGVDLLLLRKFRTDLSLAPGF